MDGLPQPTATGDPAEPAWPAPTDLLSLSLSLSLFHPNLLLQRRNAKATQIGGGALFSRPDFAISEFPSLSKEGKSVNERSRKEGEGWTRAGN